MMRQLVCGMAVLGLLSNDPQAVGQEDLKFAWRSYLTPEEWKAFDASLTAWTLRSQILGSMKDACGVSPGEESAFHFTDALVRANILRPGVEVDRQRRDYDDNYRLLHRVTMDKGCDRKKMKELAEARQAGFDRMLEAKVKGGQHKLRGDKRYR